MSETKYLISKISEGDGVECYLKLWYRDETILFDSIEQATEFVNDFPVFFDDIDYNIIEYTEPLNTMSYSDLLYDNEFLYEKENLKQSYVIKNPDGNMAGLNGYTIVFDSEEEIAEFMGLVPEFFTDNNYEVAEEITNLAWCFFINYYDVKILLKLEGQYTFDSNNKPLQ